MRRTVPILASVLAVLTVSAAAQQKIKVSTASVPVYVTVTDADKRLVPDLTVDDFEIFDNQKPQTLTVFENTPVPITTVVMTASSSSCCGCCPRTRRRSASSATRSSSIPASSSTTGIA
jgi:hypothetical protein